MKGLRKLIFWCHLPVGVLAGVVILTMSVTGVLLTYEKQIIAWADTREYQIGSQQTDRLPLETLLVNVREQYPDLTPTSVVVKSDQSLPAAIALGTERTVFVNPYTGEILGEGSAGTRRFFRTVTDIHRWIGAAGENRASGKMVTGAANLGFLFLVMSGFYLWWPRSLSWKQIRGVFWFKRGLNSRARDFNWHNVIGFWSAIPLFIVVLSGVVISYQWAGNLVYKIVGEQPPPARTAAPARNEGSSEKSAVSYSEINSLWSQAESQVDNWKTISLRLPTSNEAPWIFTIDRGTSGQPQHRAQLSLKRTGEVVQWEPFSSFSRGRQLRSILRFAHTGEVLGISGQAMAGLASAGGAFLVWTGLALSIRRFRVWVGRKSMKAPVQVPLGSEAAD